MIDSEQLGLLKLSSNQLAAARNKSRNAFCAFTNNPLHRQSEIVLLDINVQSIRSAIRALQTTDDPTDAIVDLGIVRASVLDIISDTILALNVVATSGQSVMNEQEITDLKHSTENTLTLAAIRLRQMFEALNIQPIEQILL